MVRIGSVTVKVDSAGDPRYFRTVVEQGERKRAEFEFDGALINDFKTPEFNPGGLYYLTHFRYRRAS